MSPVVTVTHWDAEEATNAVPEDWEDRDFSPYAMPEEPVLPRCPLCHRPVESYAVAVPGGEQANLGDYHEEGRIFLRPCNHRTPPGGIGLVGVDHAPGE